MKRIGIAAVAALACGACVAQTGAHEEDFGNVAPYDDMDVGLASEELLSDVEHVWHQGQPERWLMPASDGICVLTGVSGAFRGGGERVEVNVDPAWNWWRITGSSGQSGVSARARCLSWSEMRGIGAAPRVLGRFSYVDWGNLSDGESLWPVDHRTCDFTGYSRLVTQQMSTFCWLAGMSGIFDGGAEHVGVFVSDDLYWNATAGNCTEEPFVDAVSYCADFGLGARSAWYGAERTWRQGDAPVDLGSATGSLCALTRVAGEFRGAGEAVWITQRDGRWLLEGQSAQSGVEASARCVSLRQTLDVRFPFPR